MTRPPSQPRWNELNIEERRSYARVVVSSWTARHGPLEPLRIALPAGSGSNLLFRILSSDFARIGVPSVRVDRDADADLRLIDEVAPYDSALWYLGRISCAYELAFSSVAADRHSEVTSEQSIELILRKLYVV